MSWLKAGKWRRYCEAHKLHKGEVASHSRTAPVFYIMQPAVMVCKYLVIRLYFQLLAFCQVSWLLCDYVSEIFIEPR